MKGIVIRSTGSWYQVEKEDGSIIECKLRGQFRIKGIRATNPIAVGDHVKFIIADGKNTGMITEIEERDNYIIRKATRLSKKSHIIASNIDQAVIVATLAHPRTSTGFIDRFLTTAEAYHIPAIIVFNKIDLYNDEEKEALNAMKEIYDSIGYKTLETSAIKGINLDEFKSLLQDKRSLISGHSGVGKSALINGISSELNLRVGEISEVHQKGKHTTTFAQMFKLPFGGHIIDTPGIKEFGLSDFEKEEVADRFPEMRELKADCQFSNCLHIQEPNCAVKDALENGEIAEWRYENYLNIINNNLEEQEY